MDANGRELLFGDGGRMVHHREHGEHREEWEMADARVAAAWSVLREVEAIVNQGGDVGEKLIDARMRLASVDLDGRGGARVTPCLDN